MYGTSDLTADFLSQSTFIEWNTFIE